MGAVTTITENTERRLLEYYKAETAILTGGESYTIGSRTLTRPDIKYIQEQIEKLEKKCLRLGGNGYIIKVKRYVPRDR